MPVQLSVATCEYDEDSEFPSSERPSAMARTGAGPTRRGHMLFSSFNVPYFQLSLDHLEYLCIRS